MKRFWNEWGKIEWGIVIIAIVAFPLCLFVSNKSNKLASHSTNKETTSNKDITITKTKDSLKWNVYTTTDEMTDSKNIFAVLRSDNYISQDFPYEGETYSSITLRYTKKYGYDVLIQIDKGQIDGRSYNGTDYITARFDGSSPKNYFINESSDGDPKIVFLRNAKEFLNKCKTAKNIKIDIPLYQAGRPVFKFHVDKALEWPD